METEDSGSCSTAGQPVGNPLSLPQDIINRGVTEQMLAGVRLGPKDEEIYRNIPKGDVNSVFVPPTELDKPILPTPHVDERVNEDRRLKQTNPKDMVSEKRVPLSLLSPVAKANWAAAQFLGKFKYGQWNWRNDGARASSYLDAIDRHRDAYISGETFDPIDGTHHLGNIMACCAILMDCEAMGNLVDDRPPSFSIRPTYEAVEAQMQKIRVMYKDLPMPIHYTIKDTK